MTAERIDYKTLRDFELGISANLQTTEENLQKLCPLGEVECFKLVLEESDIQRVFLCTAPDFATYTKNQSFRLIDTCEAARNDPTVSCLLSKNVDLSKSNKWAPVFISPNYDKGSLVAFDGNHRLMAHFLMHEGTKGVQAFLLVHQNTIDWPWFPDNAK
jgi:hypothetical protein|tara:strand:- start:108 stop:584 length:477 start_codon:yes stop_codon:yes gene_type:complete